MAAKKSRKGLKKAKKIQPTKTLVKTISWAHDD